MRRLFFAVLTALMLATAVPAVAITYGQADGSDHPMVGLVAFYNSDGDFIWRCSGTLLSPTVLLTAGHCTAEDTATGETPTKAQVWFSTSITVPTTPFDGTCPLTYVGYPCTGGDSYGTPHSDNFTGLTLPDTHDVGVVVLDTAQSGTFATLPTLGLLDSLATKRGQQDTNLVVVGYGLLSSGGNGKFANAGGGTRTRMQASQQIKDLRSALTDGYNLATTNAPGFGTGDGTIAPGGTCFGDSGGPVFYPTAGDFVVVGITSFGLNNNCKGGDYAFRTDIQETQSFLLGFGITAP